MLIVCSECGREISDKAVSCPGCGNPMLSTQTNKPRRSNKRRRLPNGFGRITKISGKNLRKPYRAMVSDEKDEYGRPIGRLLKPVSYFETYNEAYTALLNHNKNPYDYTNTMTMSELYEKWYEIRSPKVSASRRKSITAAWSYCSAIYEKLVQELRIRDVKELFDTGDAERPGHKTKIDMKSVLSQMLDYAVEYELLQHNFIKDVNLVSQKQEVKEGHKSFSETEMAIIQKAEQTLTLQMILIQCYTGLRPVELCMLGPNDINMQEWYATCGVKTKAGKDRLVPIHSKIRPLISELYKKAVLSGHEYLFLQATPESAYATYRSHFLKELAALGITGHRPHDCRKQFITMAKRAGVDEYALKRIVGHAISDLTEAVYTDRDIKWLHQELAKIP